MKKKTLLLLVIGTCINITAQIEEKKNLKTQNTVEEVKTITGKEDASDIQISIMDINGADEYSDNTKDVDDVLMIAEEMPEFPGGMTEMMKFIADNLIYPKEAVEQGIQGRVIVRFVIEKDGSVSNPKVVRKIEPILDKEAIRVVESMPKWKAGKQKGQKVPVYFTLPIIFRLGK